MTPCAVECQGTRGTLLTQLTFSGSVESRDQQKINEDDLRLQTLCISVSED